MKKLLYIPIFLFCLFSEAQSNKVEWFLEISRQQAAPTAVYDGQNAADPVNEVNGTANTNGGSETTITSSASNPQNGSYSLRIEKTGGGDNDTSIATIQLVGVSNGDTVVVEVYADEGSTQGTNWFVQLASFDGWTSSESFNVTSTAGYNLYTFAANQATTDSPNLRIATTTSGDEGDIIDIDNIVITIQ